MAENTQHKLDRVRPPRVQITYDVEIGDAIVKKEIPFVVGILAELSGKNQDKLLPLKERKFVEIDRDNFDKVMNASQPEIDVKAYNWIETGELKLIKIFKELHNLGSELSARNAKTFIFHNGDDLVDKVCNLLKDFAPDKINEIDDLLLEIRDKADNSGELDDTGSNFLRRFTKLLKHFKFHIAAKEKTLDELFKPILDEISKIANDIGDGKYNSKVIRDMINDAEEKVSKSASSISSTFKFNALDDFSPLRILHQIPELKEHYQNKQYLADLLNKLDGNAQLLKGVTEELVKLESGKGDGDYDEAKVKAAIDNIINTLYPAPEPEEAKPEGEEKPEEKTEAKPAVEINPYIRLILEKFFEQYTHSMIVKEYAGNNIEANHVIKMLIEYIADINELLVNQVNEFIHAPQFQKLEASWRALHFLIKKYRNW